MIIPILSRKELLARLERTKGFNIEAFVTGPKGPDEVEIEQKERETRVFQAEDGVWWTDRISVRFSIRWGPYFHLEEQKRERKGKVISVGPKYYTGSGTLRRGEETHATAAIRELLGDGKTPGEMPRLKELLDAHGVILKPEHFDFHALAAYNGIYTHPSSVYIGFMSRAAVYNVALNLLELGIEKRPWGKEASEFGPGFVSNDMGTDITQKWAFRIKPLVEPAGKNFEQFLHREFPVEPSHDELVRFIQERRW